MRAAAPFSLPVLLGFLALGSVVAPGPVLADAPIHLQPSSGTFTEPLGIQPWQPKTEAPADATGQLTGLQEPQPEAQTATEGQQAEPQEPDPEVQRAAARQASVDDLLAIYRRIDGLLDVEVTLEDRILELSGTALSQEDRVRAAELAERVPDVVWVDNRITVETDLRRRLAPIMDRLGEKAERALRFIPSLLVGLILIGGSFVAAYFAGRWIFPSRKGEQGPFHRNLLRQALRGAIGLTGILLALELMDATALVGAVLGAAGVFGIAVGFAFRDIVENYLSGVLLSLRQPFAPSDHVELGGHEGRIVRLTGRETILMTLDGNHVRVPNATVFKSVMTNFTRNPRRRFVVSVGIAPDEAIRPALDAGQATLEGLPGVLETPPVSARVQALGDSTVELRFSGWVDQTQADFLKVRSGALKAVKERFEADGIQTPPPEYGVRILGGGEVRPADGGRAAPTESTPPARPDRPAAAGTPTELDTPTDSTARTPPADPSPADISPDTTIEEEIEREIRESDEEDLLQR